MISINNILERVTEFMIESNVYPNGENDYMLVNDNIEVQLSNELIVFVVKMKMALTGDIGPTDMIFLTKTKNIDALDGAVPETIKEWCSAVLQRFEEVGATMGGVVFDGRMVLYSSNYVATIMRYVKDGVIEYHE